VFVQWWSFLHLTRKTPNPMIRFLLYLAFACCILTGCQSKNQSSQAEMVADMAPVQESQEAKMAAPEASAPLIAPEQDTPEEVPPSPGKPAAPPAERKIVRNATIRFRVSSQIESGKRIVALVKQFNGLITNEEQTRESGNLQTAMTVRIPANRLDAFLELLLKESVYTDSKSVTAEDVTKQFVDTEARIRSQKATEEKYLQLLKQARNVQEVLAVEEQLRQMREEIEVRETELRELKTNVALSTINLTFYEVREATNAPDEPFYVKIAHNLRDGFGLVGDVVIGIFYLLPVVALVGVPIWLLIRWWRIRAKRRKSQVQKL
jgi:hypothetical protein